MSIKIIPKCKHTDYNKHWKDCASCHVDRDHDISFSLRMEAAEDLMEGLGDDSQDETKAEDK